MAEISSADPNLQDAKYLKNQLNIARNEINNLRQQLISLSHSHHKDCDDIRKKLENWRCNECKNRQELSSAASTSSAIANHSDMILNYIGTIHTHFPEKRGTPRQPGVCSNLIAKLTLNNVFTNPEHALEGLQEYSHMWILFHFHKNDTTHVRAKVAPPRLNGLRTGVFATRSPNRPAPIGLSLVKIDRIMENSIYFSGVDMIDQTPVLDIKPYIPQYDNPLIAFSSNNTDYESNSNSSNTDTSERMHQHRSSFSDNNVNEQNDLSVALDNMNIRIMDGEENGGRVQNSTGGNTNMRLSLNSNLEESYYNRSTSRIGEREAPDGEEEESPRQSARTDIGMQYFASPPEVNSVRVPNWIDQPPISSLTVLFKDRALLQLLQLGSEAEEKKIAITNVLKEDPRSVYLRERLGSHCYVFRIAELNVSCKFNDAAHTVTVFKIFPNSVSDSD